MDNEIQDTPEAEVKETQEETVETQEPTIGEILDKKDDSVPLATFLETKKEKKALEKEVADLKSKIDAGANKTEIKADLKSIADKYDVNADFLSELSSLIYSQAKGEVEETLKSKFQPLELKEKEEKINKAFNEHFTKVIEEMPEYEAVVNKDVIKSLSLLPENSKKTFQQIIEETYGKTLSGKRTMETSIPRGGKDASFDPNKMNDPEYFKQVMANPELKKKYNDSLLSRIKL